MQRTLAFTLGLAVAAACAPAQAEVKIGFLATLSGPSADVGQDQYDGFMLAIEQMQGKLGGVEVKVIREDDQMKPEVAVQALTKLLDRDKVDIVTGLTYANVLMALQGKIAGTKIPFIGSVSGPSPTAGAQCKPNLFITSWQSDATAEAMGKYLNDAKIEQLAILAPNFLGSKDKVTGLKRFYRGKIVQETYTPLTQLDFSAELAAVGSSGAKGLFAFFPGSQGVSFVRQYQQFGMLQKLPMYSVHTIEPGSVNAMGKAGIGAIVAEAWQPSADNEQSRRFVAAFEKKHKRPPTSFAAFSYDAAMLIDAAVKARGGDVSDAQALNAALRNAKFESVRGAFKFNKNNYPIQNYHIYRVVEGKSGKPEFQVLVRDVLAGHGDAYAEACGAT
ncbi:ABC transporter substrate-binding protein [Pigmentiphaga sp. NML080357]|uniref:ABC transporter substrate-binding protein n=1 Tax=Pigmentiphaga sp. NML080357 TaxID=2008675 RepID=UPI000B40AE04|nr:ABC transporter substrate-binding protein [Pigmentiphaga sp. NML080357]OVZ60624.1 ABC transporter substrate-binding protein [Pigmentiphaga sp. NML080357]